MFAKSAMLFLYVACVVLLGASFTCCVLVKIRKKTKDNRAMMIFLMGLFVVCMYDLGIYYCNYVVGMFSSTEVLRIGNCIIALAMYAWIVVQENVMKKDSLKPLGRMTKNYILFYTGLWLILTIATSVDYFYTMKWMLMLTDMILIVAAVTLSGAYIVYAAVDNQRLNLYFMTLCTAVLMWNYISYFWGETSVYWGNSPFIRAPLDLTVVFWLTLAASALVYVYKTIFKPAFIVSEEGVDSVPSVSPEVRIERTGDEFGLTKREREILMLMYRGRSNREIAELLFLSESTVKTHVYNIFRKMGIRNRVEAICIVNGDNIEEINEEQ